MHLDDEDYELLGYGDLRERAQEVFGTSEGEWKGFHLVEAPRVRDLVLHALREKKRRKDPKRRVQVREYRARYQKTEKGRKAHNKAALAYYYRNRERLLAERRKK